MKWFIKRDQMQATALHDAMMCKLGIIFTGLAVLCGIIGYEVGPNKSTDFTENMGIAFAVYFGLTAWQLWREFLSTLRDCPNECLQCIGTLPWLSKDVLMNSNPCMGLWLESVFFCVWFSFYAAGGGDPGAEKEVNETMFALVLVAAVWLLTSFIMMVFETCCGLDCSCADCACTCCEDNVKPVNPVTPVQPSYAGNTTLPAPVGNAMYSPVSAQPMPVTYDNQPQPAPVTYGQPTHYPPMPMNTVMP